MVAAAASSSQILLMTMVFLASTLKSSRPHQIALPGCKDSCGGVDVPYPFGMAAEKGQTDGAGKPLRCFRNQRYRVTCATSYNPPKLFLGYTTSNINITNISLDGQMTVLTFMGRKCFNSSGDEQVEKRLDPSLSLVEFAVNNTMNKFVVVGCASYGYILGTSGGKNYTTGCMSICNDANSVDEDGVCIGVGCCKTSFPKKLQRSSFTVGSFYGDRSRVAGFSPCTYAFVVEENKFNFSKQNLISLQNVDKLPAALDWTIGFASNETCEFARNKKSTYACGGNATCFQPNGTYGYRCSCPQGYQGNPYLPDGCQDVDECHDPSHNNCTHKELCKNEVGSYTCSCPKGYNGDGKGERGCTKKDNSHRQKVIAIIAGTSLSTTVLLLAIALFYLERERRMKENYFVKNGGDLLKEKLAKLENPSQIFTFKELKDATDNFSSSRKIGEGGYGIVYQGFLPGKRTVAIKRSKIVDPAQIQSHQIEQFINELVLLSQIKDPNVVKLYGCCLEVQIPLLVYEFIDNDTLSHHIQDEAKRRNLSWDDRLRIATETARVFADLHSKQPIPIIHRDIKTNNILLDTKLTAKVSDFGASTLVSPDFALDKTQIYTMVQGTLGYLDPEYFTTGQLTDKSDVYSFGVVLAELLTGREAFSSNKTEKHERNLATYFLFMLKQGCLSQILEHSLASEKNHEEINEVARLAKWCLNVDGDNRPYMKDVLMDLERSRQASNHSPIQVAENKKETELESGEGSSTGY